MNYLPQFGMCHLGLSFGMANYDWAYHTFLKVSTYTFDSEPWLETHDVNISGGNYIQVQASPK